MIRKIMTRKSTLILVLLLLSVIVNAPDTSAAVSYSEISAPASDSISPAVVPDTLLSARSAEEIELSSSYSMTSVTIRKINGTNDNYYYTGSRQQWNEGSTETRITNPEITDVLVIQTPKGLTVSFRTPEKGLQTYAFNFRDPENRQFSSMVGPQKNLSVNLSRNSNTRWDLVFGGLGLGWINPMDENPEMHTNMWKSSEITIMMALGVRMTHRRSEFSFGLGLNWQNFVTKGDRYFHKGEGQLTMLPYEDESGHRRSRIKIFSLQLPLLYGYSFGKKNCMKFQIGPVLNFNTSSSIKTQFKLDGREYEIKTSNVYTRPVTVDGIATLSYNGLGVYFRYSPMNKIKSGRGLDFSSVSTGFMIGF